MMLRTHLVISLFFILLLLPNVSHQISFVLITLIATYLPDIDSRFSSIGRRRLSRILQFFTRHRGVIHSFTFLIFITLILVFFFPIIALPFFLGYGLHLMADSFTVDGITPFWPYRSKSRGDIRTGEGSEKIALVGFILGCLILLILRISVMV